MDYWKRNSTMFAMTSLAFQEGLREALKKLAATHDNAPGTWLDELEAYTLQGSKTLETEGVDQDTLAVALKASHEMVRLVFREFRDSLQPTTE